MRKLLIVMSCFFSVSIQAMEGEDKYAGTVAERFDSSVPWNTLLQDVMPAIKKNFESNNAVDLIFDPVGFWTLPYTLRTINNIKLTVKRCVKYGTKQKKVLLEPRYWYGLSRLSFNRSRTHNDFGLLPINWEKRYSYFFDGINDKNVALVVRAEDNKYNVYALEPLQNNQKPITGKQSLNPVIKGKGNVRSILLHREENRCVLGIQSAGNGSNKHCIDIKNVSQNRSDLVASLETDFVLRKAIYVGKNTYLGLTEEGNLIVFWLNDENKIEYAHQDCHEKQFKDLDVDETSKTGYGFMPRVALLAKNGDVFLTDLRMGREKKVLLYSRTLDNPDNIFRFLYDKEQYAVVYKVDTGEYDTFHVWPDNFNILLAHASLKASQQRMSKEEK